MLLIYAFWNNLLSAIVLTYLFVEIQKVNSFKEKLNRVPFNDLKEGVRKTVRKKTNFSKRIKYCFHRKKSARTRNHSWADQSENLRKKNFDTDLLISY